jgi:hypothetical protein
MDWNFRGYNRKSYFRRWKSVRKINYCSTVKHTLWFKLTHCIHRYLMTRLSLQVVYLWHHESSTAPPFITWWPNFEIHFAPLHRSSPFKQFKWNTLLYSTEDPKRSLYCEMSVTVSTLSYTPHRVEFPCKASTCAVIYNRQRPHSYNGGQS